MKRVWVVLAGVLLLARAALAEGAEWEKISRDYDRALCVLALQDAIYCGTQRYLIRSADAGKSWRLTGVRGPVYDLAASGDSVYAVTGRGVFVSKDGRHWRRLTAMAGSRLAAVDNVLFLAASGGVFSSADRGSTWGLVSSELGTHILSMTLSDQATLCVVSTRGVFRRDRDGSWTKTLGLTAQEEEETEIESDDEPDEGDIGSDMPQSSLVWSRDDDHGRFTMVLGSEMLSSVDDGRTWEPVAAGVSMQGPVSVAVTGARLFLAGTRGVFEYRDGTWREHGAGLGEGTVHEIAADNGQSGSGGRFLYAASDSGLYRADLNPDVDTGAADIASENEDEPEIGEVVREAIRYADVHPDKINTWRRLAARKAWLPELRVGIDRDTSDLWHWEGGSTTREGDDVLVRGKDSVNWDVSLAWDLGELVWSTDQTSIDVRSRLMVELRDDILDQVTRLYFERLRVKHELETLPLEQADKRFDKELKIRELTASLDALTGGFFSRHAGR